MRPQSRGEMTHHEMLFVDFAEYYEEIVPKETQEALEAKLFEKDYPTEEEKDEVYKDMFQAYMDELYSLVRKGKDCIKRQPDFIKTWRIHPLHIYDMDGNPIRRGLLD